MTKRYKKSEKHFFMTWFKKPYLLFASGLILVALGILLAGQIWLNSARAQQSTTKPKPASQVLRDNKPKANNEPLIEGTPVSISIPSVSIDLKVVPGYYDSSTQTWTLSLDKAQFAVVTAKPNNKTGDTFIYAHDRVNVFYTLPKLEAGDKALITTNNGHVFTYTFTSSTITTPDDTRLFKYQGKPILILQTCTGTWYQERQLFVFDLTGVS